jgi:hypothetical protein
MWTSSRRRRARVSREFAAAEWRVGRDRALGLRTADGNVSDKEKERLTNLRLSCLRG